MSISSGYYKNNLYGDMTYQSFMPTSLFDIDITIDNDLLILLIDAHKSLASLDLISTMIPNLNLFVSMYIRKEALLSSQIEGTQATLEDILDPNIEGNMNKDVSEVISYIKAIDYGINKLQHLPLCNRLLKEVHHVLMNHTRGQEKNPGEFRKTQNWIGGIGSTIKNARYIPPNVEDMHICLSDLEKYINNNDTDPLMKAALIHYQFETIHPFLDGNGRLGRLLITLFLIDNKLLTSPSLYISYFLKKNRIEYYDRMMEVRNKNDYYQWIKFFLEAITVSSQDAIETIKKLMSLHDKNINKINSLNRKKTNVLKLFNYIEQFPIIDIKRTSEDLNFAYNTTYSYIKTLIDLNILKQTNNYHRNRTFIYKDYVDILKVGTE